MIQTFGHFTEVPFSSPEYLIIGFSPSSVPLKQRWRNNGLSADFLADYLTTFFPGREDDPVSIQRRTHIRSAVSYIANELLENAMKFNDDNSQHPISIRLHLEDDKLVFAITNSISPDAVRKFQAFIHELITKDPEELYVRQLEKNAADENCTASGLGLLTMLHDYAAKLGWKFETIQSNPEVIAVTTMVQLAV